MRPVRLSLKDGVRPAGHAARIVRVDDRLWISGFCASPGPPEAGVSLTSGQEADRLFGAAERLLQNVGSSAARVLWAELLFRDLADASEVWPAWRRVFPPENISLSMVQAGRRGLLQPSARFQLDLVAALGDSPQPILRRAAHPEAGLARVTRHGDLIFLPGLIALTPEGDLPRDAAIDPASPYTDRPVVRQAELLLRWAEQGLRSVGSDLDHVVRARVYLRRVEDFYLFDQVWRTHFQRAPARTTVQSGALPGKRTVIAMDLTAVPAGSPGLEPKVIEPADAPPAGATYSPAIRAGNYVFVAGHLASDFSAGIPPEARTKPGFPYHGSDAELQARYVLKNLHAALRAAGVCPEGVVKAHLYLTDLRLFYEVERAWRETFPDPPARTVMETAGTGLLVPGTVIEIDLLAVA